MKKLFCIICILILPTSLFGGTKMLNNLFFVESSSLTIGEHQANRPHKVYVSSEIIVGNSIIINGNSLSSTELEKPILSVSTIAISFPQKIEVEGLEIKSSGFKAHGKGKFAQDIEISTSTRGLVLTSDNGNKYLVWVDDNGSLFTTKIASSPEITHKERLYLMEQKRKEIKNYRKLWKKATLEQKVNILGKYLLKVK